MRPKQWIKNGFVLAPLIFSGLFTDIASLASSLLATFLFCVASSATYIVNDYRDIELDRQHPLKCRKRPLASGQVSKSQALALLAVLYSILVWGYFQQPSVTYVILLYLALNLAYTFWLKNKPVIDIFTIAICFILRVYAGAAALSVPVSYWMSVTTLCLALYLAVLKRRQELFHSGEGGRKVLEYYSVSLLDRYAEMSATGALIFYSLFIMNQRPEMIITIPFVLFGFFRYRFVVDSLEGGESPTDALFSDIQLALTVAIWILITVLSLWTEAV